MSSHEPNSSSNSPQKRSAGRSLSDKNRGIKGESDGKSILIAVQLKREKFPRLSVEDEEEEGDGMPAPGNLSQTYDGRVILRV